MCSHTTKRCSWHEFPSACAAGLREGRHPSGVSCSLCRVWGRHYGKELLSGMVLLWDTSRALGLHSTHVGWWAREMRKVSSLPQKNAKQRGIWVTPPLPLFLWCSVLSVRTRQGSGASFRAVWASQLCTRGQKPSRRLVLQHRGGRKIVSWGEYGSHFFADKGHGLSRYPYYPRPWYNYFIWPIAQAILCGQEMFSVCAGPPPRKTLAWFSLAELQTVPLTIFPFCLFPLPHSHSFIPSVSRF